MRALFGGWDFRQWVGLFASLLASSANRVLGDVLISSGDDGKIRTWKRAYDATKNTAEWVEYSVVGTRPGDEEILD